jgi:hypothetical protein
MTGAIQDGRTQILFEVVCLYGLCHRLLAGRGGVGAGGEGRQKPT